VCEKHAKGPKENGFCFSPPSFPSNCKHESRRAVAAELALKQGIEAMDTPPNEARKIVLKKNSLDVGAGDNIVSS